MKRIKTFAMFEMIKVPIKVGDTVLGGRFKNRKTLVKKIGKNPKGDLTINGKPLLKFRIIKEDVVVVEQLIKDCLQDLEDDGFKISINLDGDLDEIRINKKGHLFRIGEVEESIIDLSSHLKGVGIESNNIHYHIIVPYGMEDSMKAPQEMDDGWRTEMIDSIDTLSDVEVNNLEIFLKTTLR